MRPHYNFPPIKKDLSVFLHICPTFFKVVTPHRPLRARHIWFRISLYFKYSVSFAKFRSQPNPSCSPYKWYNFCLGGLPQIPYTKAHKVSFIQLNLSFYSGLIYQNSTKTKDCLFIVGCITIFDLYFLLTGIKYITICLLICWL